MADERPLEGARILVPPARPGTNPLHTTLRNLGAFVRVYGYQMVFRDHRADARKLQHAELHAIALANPTAVRYLRDGAEAMDLSYSRATEFSPRIRVYEEQRKKIAALLQEEA